MIEDHPLFQDKVYARGVKSIPRTNSKDITTIVGLYDALDSLLHHEIQELDLQKRKRPEDSKLESFYKRAVEWFRRITRKLPPLAEIQDSNPEERVAGRYRSADGGHLIFRPIGFVIVHRVAYWLIRSGCSLSEAAGHISSVPMQLNQAPWKGLLWDDVNKRMLYAAENQRAAEGVMFYGAGGNLPDVRSSPDDLREELSGILNRPSSSVRLRCYI